VCTVVHAFEVVMLDPTRQTAPDIQAGGGPGFVLPEFDALFRAEQPSLLALAFTLTGNRALAEDLVQETFLRLYRRWDRLAGYERPGAWLRKVLLNLSRSRARRLAVEARGIARLGRLRPSEPVVSSETTEFWAAVRALPGRQAEILTLYYLDDRSVAEVAEILDLAEGTVRAHLHKGRISLRARLTSAEESTP
jgi:RNA polymerase sigma-70 factor (ECF subfamily)